MHEFNFLGVTFDDHLNKKLYFERWAIKCSRNIGMLNKLQKYDSQCLLCVSKPGLNKHNSVVNLHNHL